MGLFVYLRFYFLPTVTRILVSRGVVPAVVFTFTALVPAGISAQLVVNEFYYDHPGPDDGYEFIEIFNAFPSTVCLDGVGLEFHNGADDGWVTLWAGSSADSIPARGLFVVGGALVRPPVSWETLLRLQNGPDAIRLTVGGSTADLVGYGFLDDEFFIEGESAPGVPAGFSLGRLPDGRDTQNNSSDFTQMVPSPGRLNLPGDEVSVAPGGKTPAGKVLREDGREDIDVELFNGGTRVIPQLAVVVEVWDSTSQSVGLEATLTNTNAIASGERWVVSAALSLNRGYHWLVIRALFGPDERPGNNEIVLLRRVGGPRILVSEILSYPVAGCPQFVELYNAGLSAQPLGGFKLKDAVSRPAVITSDSVFIQPRDHVVVTPDRESLLRFFPRAPSAAILQHKTTWPAFNRSGSGAVSDSVVFMDAYGLPVDAVGYPPLGSESRGRSLERVDMYGGPAPTWVLSNEPSGASPGRRNSRSLDATPAASFAVTPNPFSPYDGSTLTISVNPSLPDVRAVVCVYDVYGRKLSDLGSAAAFPAVFLWDGTGENGGLLAPGLYIATCEIFSRAGERIYTDKVVVGCGRQNK